MICRISAFCLLFSLLEAVEIPNRHIGKAEVECGEDFIDVVFLTEDTFNGLIYVVGHAGEKPDCQSEERGRKTTTISIPKDKCGVTTLRSDNPAGLFVNTKVMLQFHPQFVTKVDRGFEISCFYMQAEKTVTFPLTVSMKNLEPFTEFAEMPRCRYEVLDPETLETKTVVAVGDKLLHKWTCDSTAPSLWCMTVHTCYVDDGQGTQALILDDEGCAQDKFLLDNLEYQSNLMASKLAHAFKFADRVVVNFQCSIRLEIKDGDCDRPECAKLRRRRELVIGSGAVDIDVRTRQLDVLDPQSDFGVGTEDPLFRAAVEKTVLYQRYESHAKCVSLTTLLIPGALAGAFLVAFGVAVVLLWRTNISLRIKA